MRLGIQHIYDRTSVAIKAAELKRERRQVDLLCRK